MRHIKSSRKGANSEQTHFCPLAGHRVDSAACHGCCHLDRVKQNPTSYEAFCSFEAEADLFEFVPAKAWDKGDMPAFMGTDPLKAVANSWLEPKLDGARCILHLTSNGIMCTGRRVDQTGKFREWSANVPHIRDMKFPSELIGTVLDAEILIEATNRSTGSLGATMSVVGAKPAHAAQVQEEYGKATCYVFDMIRIGGEDIRKETQRERRARLAKFFWIYCRSFPFLRLMVGQEVVLFSEREEVFQTALAHGYEGLVAKDPSAPYGARYAWLKVKQAVTVDALVTGFEPGAFGSKYEYSIGALRVSVIDKATGLLREIGKVIPGSDARREALIEQFEGVEDIGSLRILVELEAQAWTKGYRVRHPRILRYREDKNSVANIDFEQVHRF